MWRCQFLGLVPAEKTNGPVLGLVSKPSHQVQGNNKRHVSDTRRMFLVPINSVTRRDMRVPVIANQRHANQLVLVPFAALTSTF